MLLRSFETKRELEMQEIYLWKIKERWASTDFECTKQEVEDMLIIQIKEFGEKEPVKIMWELKLAAIGLGTEWLFN